MIFLKIKLFVVLQFFSIDAAVQAPAIAVYNKFPFNRRRGLSRRRGYPVSAFWPDGGLVKCITSLYFYFSNSSIFLSLLIFPFCSSIRISLASCKKSDANMN